MKKYLKRVVVCVLMLCMLAPDVSWAMERQGTATLKSITVSTQKALDSALDGGYYTNVIVKTDKKATFKIKRSKYATGVICKAPNATFVNNKNDVSIYIYAAKKVIDNGTVGSEIRMGGKGSTNIVLKDSQYIDLWVARGKSNITGTAKYCTVVVGPDCSKDRKPTATVDVKSSTSFYIQLATKGATLNLKRDADVGIEEPATVNVKKGVKDFVTVVEDDADISIAKGVPRSDIYFSMHRESSPKLNLKVNGGVHVIDTMNCAPTINLSGKTDKYVKVWGNGTVNTSVKTKVEVQNAMTLKLKEGSEGSTVKTLLSSYSLNAKNNSVKDLKITDYQNKVTSLSAGDSMSVRYWLGEIVEEDE